MENEDQFTQFIINLIEEHHGSDMAEAEFKRILADDTELRDQYREWCDERSYAMRNGFRDFADEYSAERDSIWDTLEDYDDNDE